MRTWTPDFGIDPTPELAVRLALELGATDARVGTLSNWHKTSDNWRCPCCSRKKSDIVRLDKLGSIYGPIVEHHDHIIGVGPTFVRPIADLKDREAWAAYSEKLGEYKDRLDGLIRFPNTWICGDCNNADAAAKATVNGPQWFSFSPFEIRQFVVPRRRQANDIRSDVVRTVYEPALCQVEMLRERRVRIIDAFNVSMQPEDQRQEQRSDPVHVGQVAWNILKEVNKARKETP